VVEDAAEVIADVFDEAERRDSQHQRTWVALVDGNSHQIDRIENEAASRKLKITIIIDFIHVLEYLWVHALVWSTRVLWYSVDKKRLVTLVIVRDPDGIMRDDFFVTDDPEATDAEIVARYAGRWAIEVTFREVKQCLGGEDPQSWKRQGPERAANLSLWLYSAIWIWHITTNGCQRMWTVRPWYQNKKTPSFLDALAALRRSLWAERITPLSFSGRDHTKIIDGMLDVLATAA
jgi:hypothetical protein